MSSHLVHLGACPGGKRRIGKEREGSDINCQIMDCEMYVKGDGSRSIENAT